jgi:hypothetical protein
MPIIQKAKEDFGMDIGVCQWTKFLSQRGGYSYADGMEAFKLFI